MGSLAAVHRLLAHTMASKSVAKVKIDMSGSTDEPKSSSKKEKKKMTFSADTTGGGGGDGVGQGGSAAPPPLKKKASWLKRRMSSKTSLAEQIRSQVLGERDPWKTKHINAPNTSNNLKQSRAAARHVELANPKKAHQGKRVAHESTYFSSLASAYDDHAAKLETCVKQVGDDLPSKIGAALLAAGVLKESGGKLTERHEAYVAWDKNGDGRISQMEWRVNIRKIPGCQVDDVHDIDELFNTFDADRSGFIDASELGKAFKSWREAAQAASAEVEAISERAEKMRELCRELRRAARHTRELETQEAMLAELMSGGWSNPSGGGEPDLACRIGAVLLSRNKRAADITRPPPDGWDANNDGKVDVLEFRHHLRKLGGGLQAASDKELDTLFKKLDVDGSGELVLTELERPIAEMREAAAKHAADREEQLVLVKAMVAPVKQSQEAALKALEVAEPLPEVADDGNVVA